MATRMKMDLLTAVEQIVELAKESQLSKEFFRKADKYIKYVSNQLELTKEQSVMIALFINRSDDDRILIRELSKDVNCSTIRILRYLKEIDELEKKELIRCCRERRCSISYRVPYDVIEAFKRDEKYVPKKCTNLTCVELFGELEEIFELRNDNEITFDAMNQKAVWPSTGNYCRCSVICMLTTMTIIFVSTTLISYMITRGPGIG